MRARRVKFGASSPYQKDEQSTRCAEHTHDRGCGRGSANLITPRQDPTNLAHPPGSRTLPPPAHSSRARHSRSVESRHDAGVPHALVCAAHTERGPRVCRPSQSLLACRDRTDDSTPCPVAFRGATGIVERPIMYSAFGTWKFERFCGDHRGIGVDLLLARSRSAYQPEGDQGGCSAGCHRGA